MRKTAFVVLAIALVGIVAAAGCISTDSPAGEWYIPGTDITMTITPEGSVSGHAPVNLFIGTCVIDGEKLTFNLTNMGATLMMGPEIENEDAFFEAIKSVDSFKTESGKLVLMSEGKEVLTFAKAIFGTFVTEDGITVTFNRDMTFTANGPVNLHSGSYAYTENGIEFEINDALSTMAFGSEEDMAAEDALLAALKEAKTFSVENGKLALGKLTLTASALGNWETIDGVTLVLNDDGTFAGQAQVNNYFGEYEVKDGKVTFKNAPSTRMMGAEEDMAAEAAFLAALEANTFEAGQFLTAEGITFIRA